MTQTMQDAPPATDAPQYTISDDDKKRVKAIADAWKAYDGELDKPLDVLSGQLDDNVMSNRCEPIVNTGVHFLFGKEVEISVEEGIDPKAQDFLNNAWGRKEVRIPLLQDIAMNGAMSGRAFLRIVPSNDKAGREMTFRLIAVDPATVYVQTAPQDVETVLLYCIQYSCMEKVNGREQEVYYREEIARIDPDGYASQGKPDDDDTWALRHWTFTGTKGMQPKPDQWKPAGPPILWPYPFAPIFSCKNRPRPNSFWGRPDITPDLIGMNNSYNFTQSNIQKILKIYGHPIPYATGIGDSDIRTEPGRVTILPPDGKMGAIDFHSDIPSALAFAKDLRSDINEQSSIPGVATGRADDMPRGQISGIALELDFMSITKKTETKQCLYGKLIIDVSKALLQLNNMSSDIDISLAWQDALPHDDLQALQAAVLKKQIGVSDTTIQREQGYDPEEELELSQSEDAAKLTAFSQGQGMPGMMPPAPGMPPQAPMPGMPGQSPFLGGR